MRRICFMSASLFIMTTQVAAQTQIDGKGQAYPDKPIRLEKNAKVVKLSGAKID